MVTLKKEAAVQREVKVEHLLTEEQTIAQMVKTQAENEIAVEIRQPAAPLAVADNTKNELEEAKKEADWAFKAFTWAIFAITVLLFVFNWVLAEIIIPDNPNLETLFVILQLVFGSLMLGTLMTNVFHALHIDF